MNGTRTIVRATALDRLRVATIILACIIKSKEIGASGMLRTVAILENGADCQIRWTIRGEGCNRLERLQGDGCARGDLAGVQHRCTGTT